MKSKLQAGVAEACAGKVLGVATLFVLGACAQAPQGVLPPPLLTPPDLSPVQSGEKSQGSVRPRSTLQVSDAPAIPDAARQSTIKGASQAAAASGERADITLMFDQLPLPTFVQVVFGSILKKNFSMDPVVAAKTDLVVLRSGTAQTPSEVLETSKMLLKQYGVAVTEMGGFYRIAPDSNLSAYLPEIRRGRAQPEVPLPLRPVFNLVEMSAVKNSDVAIWLKAMFGTKINIQEDSSRNALLISGQSADITAALEAIQVLDQPLMRGRSSRLLTPSSLSADDMARRLADVLTAEGYSVSSSASGGSGMTAISLLPIPASNAILVFAIDPAVVNHIVEWARKLDALDVSNRRNGNYFTYEVKYGDAQTLAKTMQELLSANAAAEAAAAQAQAAAIPAGSRVIGAAPTAKSQARIVVNRSTNTLIFSCTQEEFSQLQSIMRELDQPAKSALIEVTVAEVTLTDKNQLGVEWGFTGSSGGGSVVGGTQGGLGLGAGGLTVNFLNSAQKVRASLNAMASANRATILSAPRLMARNGEVATIQVGAEVPTITSQQSTNTGLVGGATNGILQTIQYRNTGVILKVKPIIFAGNRIELEVSQEVSDAAETKTGVNSSPTISSRKIETKLSVRDGATVLLGGLMSKSGSKNDTGIPLLKDIPIAGQLFRANSDTMVKTELIVLITPYVIGDDLVAEQVTEAFRSQLGGWAQWDKGLPAPSTVVRPGQASGASVPAGTSGSVSPSSPVPPPAAAASAPESAAAPTSSVTVPTTPKVVSEQPGKSKTSAAGDAVAPAGAASGVVNGLPADLVGRGKPVTDPALLEELRRAKATPAGAVLSVPDKGNPRTGGAAAGKNTAKRTSATKKKPDQPQ